MSSDSQAWQPRTILRFVQAFPTSAATALVATDQGSGYLKALGNSTGPHLLACEWVGTHLARRLNLPTLDFALIDVTEDDEIPFAEGGRHALPGKAFITRAETGGVWGGSSEELRKLENPQDIARLVVFDTWTLNCDRHHPDQKARRPHYDNVFLSTEAASSDRLTLKAIDHTHCFTCGRDVSPRLNAIDRIRDSQIWGLFPGFEPHFNFQDLAQALNDLRLVKLSEVEAIVYAIPSEWEVNQPSRAALVEFIMRRAAFVADNLTGIIGNPNQ